MESLATSVVVGGRYRLDGVLGEGGMARVFDAFDLTLERSVAVKVLRPEADALPDVQRRFQQEARFAAQIHDPHIVAVLDFGEDKGHSYMVMERLSGVTLRNEMNSGPLTPSRVVLVVTEMLSALRAAHRRGVLHRDIKPSNVLVQDDGHVKLTDFGIAKGFSTDRPLPNNPDETITGVVLGTPGYVAPERAAGLPASVQSDLYSVGAVMVEALTGTRPAPGSPLPHDVPPSLLQIATRALGVDPATRFESADAMLSALRPATHPADTPTRVTESSTEPQPRTGPQATAGLVVPPTAVVGPSATAAFTSGPPDPPRRRHGVRTALALCAAAACALLVSLFVLLEGGAQTTGRDTPQRTPTVASTTPTTAPPTTTSTFSTTTTVLKHHGNPHLRHLQKEERAGLISPGSGAGHTHGGSGTNKG